MLKKLPHRFSYRDLDNLLQETELAQYAKRRHIPKKVHDRREDPLSPLAFAFVHFESAEHAEIGIKTLGHYNVWDWDAGSNRQITVDHAKSNWEPSKPGVPSESSNTITPRVSGSHVNGKPQWIPKSTSVPDDTNKHTGTDGKEDENIQPQTDSTTASAHPNTAKHTKSKKSEVKSNPSYGDTTNLWDESNWEYSQWDSCSSQDNSHYWWTESDGKNQGTAPPHEPTLPALFPGTDVPRFLCIVCRMPFLKWFRCALHIKTSCLPVGNDPGIIDDDEDIKKICRRLVNPFVTPDSPLSA